MANEANVRVALSILKRSGGVVVLDARHSRARRKDVTGTAGPTPGSVSVPQAGLNIDLSQLSEPGLCYMENQGSVPINWGIADPDSRRFYALGTMAPGDPVYLGKLYQFLGEYEEAGTGTGSFSSTYYFHLKAVGAAGRAFVGVYEA